MRKVKGTKTEGSRECTEVYDRSRRGQRSNLRMMAHRHLKDL
ncbi:hypothetical protein [Porphyromonas macacae]|nr:hypothetical protein [Porphyromonas macacae]